MQRGPSTLSSAWECRATISLANQAASGDGIGHNPHTHHASGVVQSVLSAGPAPEPWARHVRDPPDEILFVGRTQMTDPFFEIGSPADLLEKAKRDYARMKADTSTDTIFNFFVTTYHVFDYVRALGTVNPSALERLFNDADFKMCQFLCNKGKHIKLRTGESYEAKYQPPVPGGTLGSFILGADRLAGPERFVVLDGTEEVDVIDLGTRLIEKWERFFSVHGVSTGSGHTSDG